MTKKHFAVFLQTLMKYMVNCISQQWIHSKSQKNGDQNHGWAPSTNMFSTYNEDDEEIYIYIYIYIYN